MSIHAAKTDLNNARGSDTSKLSSKSDLVSLKAEVDKLNIEKLVAAAVDLSKLSDVIIKDVDTKFVMIAKVNNVDTSEFVLKTKYDTDTSELEKNSYC